MAKGTTEHARMRPRQKKAIELFKAQVLTGTFKSIEDTLLEADYAPESARQITNVMSAIKPHIQGTIDWMEEHRRKVFEQMERKVETADYADLSRSLNVLTHNIQLLGGKPTQNIAISAEVRSRLDELIDT